MPSPDSKTVLPVLRDAADFTQHVGLEKDAKALERFYTRRAQVAFNLVLALMLASSVTGGAASSFANAVTNGMVTFAGLSEASGVQASRNNANVLWTHNDSGHPAQVFALDTQGRLLGTYALPGNTDNEDIAMGPGPVTNVVYLYVGDIGDNGATRPNIKVYQMPEPAVYGWQYTNPVTSGIKGQRTITLTYPDGARDAESMFVDPVTGDLFILSKASTSRIYTASKAQLDTNDNFTLTFVRTLAFNVPNAADISPSGNEIIVRQENSASLWTRAVGQSVNDAFSGTAISIPVTGTGNGEPNGEAIGFDAIGSGYFTLSDDATTQPLRYFARTSNDGPGPVARALVSAGDSWRYLDDGSNQGATWRNPGFNDGPWKNGAGQFGYGEGDETTGVSYGNNANNKYVTTYFRKTFVASNAADVTNLMAKLVLSHGAALYLNGTPTTYQHLSPGAAYNTLATFMPVNLQSTWHSYSLDPRLLVEGTNTLAVEVHQSSITSSNLSFDLQLLAASRGTAYEPFDYPEGTPLVNLTNAAGQWWSSAGPVGSSAVVVASNLPMAGLAPPYGNAMQFGAVDGPTARFNLTSIVTAGTLYYSCALKVLDLGTLTAAGGCLGGFNDSRGAQGNTPTVLGAGILARTAEAGGFNLGVAKNSTNSLEWVWAPNVFSTNETLFLVGAYTFNGGTAFDDVSTLWVNPSMYDFGADMAPAATLTATTGADMMANQIASFVFLQGGLNDTNQPKSAVADELRIGSSWASVTPVGVIPPTLNVALAGTQVELSWRTNAAGFQLESASALDGTNVWTNVAGMPGISGTMFVVTNDGGGGAAFYRLKK